MPAATPLRCALIDALDEELLVAQHRGEPRAQLFVRIETRRLRAAAREPREYHRRERRAVEPPTFGFVVRRSIQLS